MNTLTLGVRNAFRNSVRTGSLIIILGLSIGLCLVMLIAYQAVGAKISQVKASIGNTINISPAGFSSFSDANNGLTTDQLSKVKALAHVATLTETLSDRLTTEGSASFGPDQNAGTTSLQSPVKLGENGGTVIFRGHSSMGGELPANFSLPVQVLGTTSPGSVNGSALSITSGSAIDGSKDSNDALISSAMASKNSLSAGSAFTAYGSTLTVKGIFTSTSQGQNNTVVLSLPAAQRLSGQGNNVTDATVTVDSLDNLASVTSAVKQTLGNNVDVQSAQDEADAAVQPLQNVQNISLVSLIGAVIAGSVIILLTMVMIVRERRREIGILKAIGASNTRVILQFMSEALTLTIAGALVGVVIGLAGANPVTNMLVSSSASSAAVDTSPKRSGEFGASGGQGFRAFAARPITGNVFQRGGKGLLNSIDNISVNIGWNILGYGLAAALLIAAIGSAFAGWMIARVKPYEVMRAE